MAKQLREQKRLCEARLRELDKQAEVLELKKRVHDQEVKLGLRRERKKPTWSKAMMVIIFLVCIEIIIYSEAVMWKSGDLSGLYSLIAAAASMFGTFWAYSVKSTAQNSKGGITYDMAMLQMQGADQPSLPDEVADDDEVTEE